MHEQTVISRLRSRMKAPPKHARLAFVPTSEMRDNLVAGYRAALDRVEVLAAALADPATWRARPPAFTSVVLVGSFGTGKTRLAVKLLAHAYVGLKASGWRMAAFEVPLFARARELGDLRFRPLDRGDERDDIEDLRDRVFRSRFLVLDDIGRTSGYKGEAEFLERVVEARVEAELPTVVTASSLPASERLTDFLAGADFERIPLTGESRRADG